MWTYQKIVDTVLTCGTRKENRTGVDTISYFNLNYEHDLANGFPLLTTKKMNFKHIVMEVLWYLSGSTNIKFLQKHGCHFWDAWADESGEVPSAYGHFWRHFPSASWVVREPCGYIEQVELEENDQLAWVIEEIKRNPMSRRLAVSAWDPDNAQYSALPPCHAFFVFNVQNNNKGEQCLNLHLTQRSCDIALGLPYNLAGYSLLLLLIARFTGLKPGKFAHTLVDAHIYTCKPDGTMSEYDHVPGLCEQKHRNTEHLPSVSISPDIQALEDVERLLDASTEEIMEKFKLWGYKYEPAIAFKVAV